jgi:hypothetical protein
MQFISSCADLEVWISDEWKAINGWASTDLKWTWESLHKDAAHCIE